MKKIVLAALVATAAGGAFAQTYLGATVGATHLNADCTGTSSCDNDDTGYKLYGGYKFTPNFAAEAGYISFGKAKATVGASNLEIETHAILLALAARGDFMPNLSGVARLGIANVDTKATVAGVGSTSETKAKAYFGLGLEYAFTKNLKGVVDADFTDSEVAGSTGAVRMLSIGAQYNF